MEERRKLERFELSAPARVVIETEGNMNERLDLTTKDVSSDGAYLFCPQTLPEGATVRMEFLISLNTLRKIAGGNGSKARVRVKGKVIRVDGNGAAIRFSSKYRISALESGYFESP